MWDLSFPTRDRICTSCLGGWSLNPWPTREIFKPAGVGAQWARICEGDLKARHALFQGLPRCCFAPGPPGSLALSSFQGRQHCVDWLAGVMQMSRLGMLSCPHFLYPTPHPALRDTVWWIIWSVDCATWKLGVRIYSMEMLGLELGRQHFRLPWESGLWGGGQEPGFIQACSKGQEIWIMRFLLTREN